VKPLRLEWNKSRRIRISSWRVSILLNIDVQQEENAGANLADFTKASFGDDYTSIKDTNWATDSTVSGPISDFGSTVEKITQVDDTLFIEARPLALSTDGSSFTSTWVEYN
jgi:hypothetical protein